MNSRQLQYVITVAETRSFSEAAGRLMISQPSLSQYISKLETEIGVQIFERSVPLRVTYAGELYIKMARKILAEEAELQDRLADLKGGLSGILKIGSGYLNAVAVLPEIIAVFQKKYPNVQIEVYEDTEPKLKTVADEGDVDLILATSHFDSAAYEKVEFHGEDYLFAVPKSFGSLGEGREDSILDLDIKLLEKVPIVRLPVHTYMRELVDSLYDSNHIKPKVMLECTTALCAYSMVKAGVGATMIPYSMYKMDHSPLVDYYSIRELAQKRQVSLYYNKSKYLNNLAKEFIWVGQNYYKGMPE